MNNKPIVLFSILVLGVVAVSGNPSDVARLADFTAYNEILPGTDLEISMVPVSGGTFAAGSPIAEPGRSHDEGPVHTVMVGDFWMSTMEISWDQYEIFLYREWDADPHPERGNLPENVDGVASATMPYVNFNLPGHPVTNVTQYAASTFCEWLTAKTGRYYRLPTEAEWEYACRGGTTSSYYFGDDAEMLGDYAWFAGNSGGGFHPVGQKYPNALGLYDMHGNAAEWVLDVYDSTVYAHLPDPSDNPVVLKDVLYPHVFRGGSWKDGATDLRSAHREYSTAALKKRDPQFPKSLWWLTDAGHIGFRIVRPVVLPEDPELYRIRPIKEY